MAKPAPSLPLALHPDLEFLAQSGMGWFRDLDDKAIRRGVFHSVPNLIAAIEAYLSANNDSPRPFIWTATVDEIMAKIRRGRVALQQLVPQN